MYIHTKLLLRQSPFPSYSQANSLIRPFSIYTSPHTRSNPIVLSASFPSLLPGPPVTSVLVLPGYKELIVIVPLLQLCSTDRLLRMNPFGPLLLPLDW